MKECVIVKIMNLFKRRGEWIKIELQSQAQIWERERDFTWWWVGGWCTWIITLVDQDLIKTWSKTWAWQLLYFSILSTLFHFVIFIPFSEIDLADDCKNYIHQKLWQTFDKVQLKRRGSAMEQYCWSWLTTSRRVIFVSEKLWPLLY